MERFEELSHGVLLYNDQYDDTYFVTQFLGGLNEDIRLAIALHRPSNVQEATALALLKEEELTHSGRKGASQENGKFSSRSFVQSDKPKPPSHDKSDRHTTSTSKGEKQASDDKLKALLAYRKKNGLCYKCGDKWGHNHTCPPQVPLHVIEELFDALEPTEDGDTDQDSEPDTVLVVSDTPKNLKRKTMRLHGQIGNQDVLILVDSGSVATFISSQLADQLQCSQQTCTASQYMTADGSPMVCDKQIDSIQWTTQGHTFSTTVGILPLKCFDMILGEDWLEDCSPMWVHWKKKLMKFTHKGQRICLRGVQSEVTKCPAIGVRKLNGLLRRRAISHCIEMKVTPVSAASRDPDLPLHSVASAIQSQIPEIQKLLSD